MNRRLTSSAVAVLLLAATAAVLWSGLNWPPPLWIIEYGMPGSQAPTGRVAVVEGIEFVEISRGYFRMGSDRLAEPGDLVGRLTDPPWSAWGIDPVPSGEMPVRWVEFPRPFWLARTAVRNEDYEQFAPGHERGRRGRGEILAGDADPAVWVSLDEARAFCAWQAERSGLPLGLPSEAEWECACRARRLLDDAAYLQALPRDWRRMPGGSTTPNPWGFLGFHGSVMEWCADHFHDDYQGAPADARPWIAPIRVPQSVRGGRWVERDRLRPASRWREPFWSARHGQLGFRLGFTLAPDHEHLVTPYLAEDR